VKKKKPLSDYSDADLEAERCKVRDAISALDMRFKNIDQELNKRRTWAPHLKPWPWKPSEWRRYDEEIARYGK
jgi:hypothetical protein